VVNKKKEHEYDFACKPNDDLECAGYMQKASVLDDESEEKDMEVSENEEKCIKTIFQQWIQEEIRLFYQEIS